MSAGIIHITLIGDWEFNGGYFVAALLVGEIFN